MQIKNTTPNFTGRVITIKHKDNKNVKYLSNKVVDMISEPEHRIPTIFSNKDIKIESQPDFQRNINIVVEKLKKAGIIFLDQIK